jgi:hypothetical protein
MFLSMHVILSFTPYVNGSYLTARLSTWAACLYVPCHAPAFQQQALAAGHRFFLSTNGVLLTEGPLPVEFVQEMSEEEAVDGSIHEGLTLQAATRHD